MICARIAVLLLLGTWPALCPPHLGLDMRPAILHRLVRGIARHENCAGWNNPGCLSFAGQLGAVRMENGYARFGRREDGERALEGDVRVKLGRGFTVAEVVGFYNAEYLEDLLRETGLREGDRWKK